MLLTMFDGGASNNQVMRSSLSIVIAALVLAAGAVAQSSSSGATNPAGSQASGDKRANAASAAQDNSGISGDQVTKPAGAKTSSITGCIDGPDADGHYTLRSMQYRSGVEVLGPDDLGTAAGQKVKLTGEWLAGTPSASEPAEKSKRRFQATSFDLMADKCPPPSETTPISKAKQKQQKAAAERAGTTPQ